LPIASVEEWSWTFL